MDMDQISDVNEKLFGSDHCTNDPSPWGSLDRMDDEDLSSFLDLDSNFCTDDFIDQLPHDLEMPMLQDEPLLGGSLIGLPLDGHYSDSSDSGIEFPRVLKSEPLSPSSSNCSDFSLDSAQSYGASIPHCAATDMVTSDSQLLEELGFHINDSLIPEISQEETLNAIQIIKQEIPNIVNIPSSQTTQTISGDKVVQIVQQDGMSVVKIEDHKPLTPPLTPTSAVSVIQGSSVIGGNSPLSMTSLHNGVGNVVKVIMAPQSQINGDLLNALSTKNPAVAKVLNNNTKVLPKPAVTTIPSTGASKTLVLTAEEFAKLTSQKLLNIKTNPGSAKPMMTPQVVQSYRPAPAVIKTSLSSPSLYDPNVKTVKRQQRMMKNRESACLSRKRKKEYLTTLEDQLHAFTKENEKLKSENVNLRKTVSFLQSENCKLKKVVPSSIVKGSTVVLSVLLLMSLNLGPLMSIVQGPSPANNNLSPGYQVAPEVSHHGRTLMALDFSQDQTSDEFFNLKRLEREWKMLKQSLHLTREDAPPDSSKDWSPTSSTMLAKHIDTLTGRAICPTHFNMTESQRLLKELRGWVQGYENEQKRQDKQQNDDLEKEQKLKKKATKNYRKKYSRKTKKSVTDSQFHNMDYPTGPHSDYGVQVFTGREEKYRSFLQTLQRRNDTFYVVSFRQDHMLLPATAHNKTMRPRMSVIMPATGLNETLAPPDGSIAMMQIDCEVTATKLVHVLKSAVPEHLDPNVTSHNNPNMQQENYYGEEREEYLKNKHQKKPWN